MRPLDNETEEKKKRCRQILENRARPYREIPRDLFDGPIFLDQTI